MAGKARSTIGGHRRRSVKIINNAVRLNKTPSLQDRGPFPLKDEVGMGLAVEILQESITAVGKIEAHVQAETLRQLRATFTKNWESSPAGVAEAASFSKGTGRVRPTECPSQSEWFHDFWRGLESRMGHRSNADQGVPMLAMVAAIEKIKDSALAAPCEEEANYFWKVGAYLTFCTAASLRGYEGFYLDLHDFLEHLETGRHGEVPADVSKVKLFSEVECMRLPHVVLPLRGKFKGEVGVDCHLVNVAHETQSGLQPRWWADKLAGVAKAEFRSSGPAFATPSGKLARSGDYNATFREALVKVKDSSEWLEKVDVNLRCGISRTPRRTATSRAARAGLGGDLNEMNRWRSVENAGGRRTRRKMSVLYSEAVLMMPVTWRYSHAL